MSCLSHTDFDRAVRGLETFFDGPLPVPGFLDVNVDALAAELDNIDDLIELPRFRPLTQARLKELVFYSPKTGRFQYRRPGRAESETGIQSQQDRTIWLRVDANLYEGHRLAILYMTGSFPHSSVRFADGDCGNLSWSNLVHAESDVPVLDLDHAQLEYEIGKFGQSKSKGKRREKERAEIAAKITDFKHRKALAT